MASLSAHAARRLTDLFERAKFSQHAVRRRDEGRGDRRARDRARRSAPRRAHSPMPSGSAALAAQRARAALMRTAIRLAQLPLFLTVVAGFVLLIVLPGRAELALHVYALVLAAIGLGLPLVRAARRLPRRGRVGIRRRAAQAQASRRAVAGARPHGARGRARPRDGLRPPLPASAHRCAGSPASSSRPGAGSTSTRARTPRAVRSATRPGRSSAPTASRRATATAPGSSSPRCRRRRHALEAL